MYLPMHKMYTQKHTLIDRTTLMMILSKSQYDINKIPTIFNDKNVYCTEDFHINNIMIVLLIIISYPTYNC